MYWTHARASVVVGTFAPALLGQQSGFLFRRQNKNDRATWPDHEKRTGNHAVTEMPEYVISNGFMT